MITELFSNPFVFFIYVFALLVAITVHEFAHALVADRLGDPTARLLGRVTLNPFAHLDPLGTAAIVFVGFGWGKPVPFDPFNLPHPRRDAALISLAGPASNMILAIILSVFARVIPAPLSLLLEPLVYINCMLALFNLIPVAPLDGFKIISGILPPDLADRWEETERHGMIFLLALLLPLTSRGSVVSIILSPAIDFVLGILLG
jgi:Zn-dependent protease